MSITLPKGKYVILGSLIFDDASDNTGWRKLNITTTANDDTPQCTVTSTNGTFTGMQVIQTMDVTSNSITLYMNAQHSSTANSELGIISRMLKAIQIK